MTISSWKNMQVALINRLRYHVKIKKDDTVTTIPGRFSGQWYDANLFNALDYQVAVSPDESETAPADIGHFHREINGLNPVDVFFHIKRDPGYTPEVKRMELLQAIHNALWLYEATSPQNHVGATSWRHLDEPANKLLRSTCMVYHWGELERTP